MAAHAAEPDVLLQGDVLHIGFHRVGKAPYPEDIVTPGVLRALAQHLDVDLLTEDVFWGDYCYFAGVTGEAFRFLEFMGLSKPDHERPLVERYGHATAEEMYRHAFEAAGLVADLYLKPRMPAKNGLRDALVHSLRDRQWPAIGIGVFGPPEPFLITGYAEEGEVLLGWSHFQGEKQNDPNVSFEPTGQFRLRNWHEAVDGVAVITATRDRPEPRKTYRDALERAILELRTTGEGGRVLGTAAMEAWAAYLEHDAGFTGWTDPQWQKAHSDHGGTAGDLAERRALAGSFLDLAGRFLPEAAGDLAMAATSFHGSHDTVYEIWETAAKAGPFDPDLEKFKAPGRRRTMASLVRRLAQFDRRGLAFMERAADTVRGNAAGPSIPVDPVLDGMAVLEKAALPPLAAGPAWAPENVAMPNAMGMACAFLDEPFGHLNEAERADEKLGYCLWMGLSGAAFGMPSDGPERSNLELLLDALGYDCELWAGKPLAEEMGIPCRMWGWDDNLRRRIFWNLRDRRLPVLLFGCGPWPDWWLITRAEHWNAFYGYGGGQERFRPGEPLGHPENALRPVDFLAGMKGKETWTINFLRKRIAPRPTMEDLYERAIAWGTRAMGPQQLLLMGPDGSEHLSERPYQDWAQMVASDALFPPGDPATLKTRREWLEQHEVGLAERRYYGSRFLELAATRLNRPELKQAAVHFRAVHTHVACLWAHLGGLHAPDAHRRLGDRNVREAIARELREIEREDAAAAVLLTAAG